VDRIDPLDRFGPFDRLDVEIDDHCLAVAPHQEINASAGEPLECVVVRSDQEAVVVNLDIEPVEKPESVFWTDPIHKHP
jgi:hypothetical protein